MQICNEYPIKFLAILWVFLSIILKASMFTFQLFDVLINFLTICVEGNLPWTFIFNFWHCRSNAGAQTENVSWESPLHVGLLIEASSDDKKTSSFFLRKDDNFDYKNIESRNNRHWKSNFMRNSGKNKRLDRVIGKLIFV